jgi:AAA ATPase domain
MTLASAASQATSPAPGSGVLFLGREAELARLEQAIRKRESLLVWGEAGAGKSTLVSQVLSRLPKGEARWCVRAVGNGSPHDILRSIAQGFGDDPLFRSKFRAETGYGALFSHWVKAQTSLRLRGLLYRAAREGQYRIFLEDLAPMTHMLARIAKELMLNQSTPIYAIARGWTYAELGNGAALYWNDRLRLHVGGLSSIAAKELLEISIRRCGLLGLDLAGFRDDILDFSGMLPGAIVRMCEAAADAHYHFEGRIKTKLLHVDYLVNHCQGVLSAGTIGRRGKESWHG